MYLLSVVLNVILVIFLVLVTLLLMGLFIPISYRLFGKINDGLSCEGSFTWLFRCVRFNFMVEDYKPKFQVILFGKEVKIKTKLDKKQKKKNNVKPKSKNKFPGWDFIKEAICFFEDIFNIIRPKVFKIRGVYGLDDPCVTGFINAILCTINGVIPNDCIELNAIYDDEIIDIEILAEGDLKLFIIGFRSLKFILKKENRKIIFKKRNLLKHFDID